MLSSELAGTCGGLLEGGCRDYHAHNGAQTGQARDDAGRISCTGFLLCTPCRHTRCFSLALQLSWCHNLPVDSLPERDEQSSKAAFGCGDGYGEGHVDDKYCDLGVEYAILIKNRLPSTSLGQRSPCKMVFQFPPDLTHMRIFGSRTQAWLPPQEREGKLDDRARVGKYVEHSNCYAMSIVMDEKSNRAFHPRRTLMCETLEN